jgi:hypothetical protein
MDQGTDDGSRMMREHPVRFYEGLRLKRRGLLTPVSDLRIAYQSPGAASGLHWVG